MQCVAVKINEADVKSAKEALDTALQLLGNASIHGKEEGGDETPH